MPLTSPRRLADLAAVTPDDTLEATAERWQVVRDQMTPHGWAIVSRSTRCAPARSMPSLRPPGGMASNPLPDAGATAGPADTEHIRPPPDDLAARDLPLVTLVDRAPVPWRSHRLDRSYSPVAFNHRPIADRFNAPDGEYGVVNRGLSTKLSSPVGISRLAPSQRHSEFAEESPREALGSFAAASPHPIKSVLVS